MSTLTEAQQNLINSMYLVSAMYFTGSIVLFMWAYFRWGFK